MNRLVRQQTLAAVLGVDRTTLYRWRRKGLLRPAFESHPYQDVEYYEHDINRMLAISGRNTGPPPTYDDLLRGRIGLVKKSAVAQQLRSRPKVIQKEIINKRLVAIRLGADWWVTQASIDRYLEVTQYTSLVTGRVIGASAQMVNELQRQHILERHPFSNAWSVFTTAESIDAYLRRRLAPWVIPALWREERLGDARPLLSLGNIARQLNRSAAAGRLAQELTAERLDYVWSPRRRVRRYSPVAFDAYMQLERIIPRNTVAHWFSVHPTVVNVWYGMSLLHCDLPQHRHYDAPPRLHEACWRSIIQPLLSPGLEAHAWIAHRNQFKTRLLGRQLAGVRMRMSPEEVTTLAENGVLRGIRLPTGEWRFSAHAIRRAMAQLRAQSE